MADNIQKPPLPVVNDDMLVEMFTSTGAAIQAEDAKLAEEEAQLQAKLAEIQAARKKHHIPLSALRFVDDVHQGVALMVRPLSIDLVRLLSDPDSAFNRYLLPRRHGEEVAGYRETGQPELRPLEEAQAIAISPATVAMSVWLSPTLPMHPRKAQIKFTKNWGKALMLGFASGWYVRPLAETGHTRIGGQRPPERVWRYYKTRDGAMRAAYDYAVSRKLTRRTTVPPELTEAYQRWKAHDAEMRAWRKKYHAERAAAGQGGSQTDTLLLFGSKPEGRPEDLHIWHA